jgi:hypothetical protein
VGERIPISYVLPLRWEDDSRWPELRAYLRGISALLEEVLVVDGSPHGIFEAHAADLEGTCRHVAPDPSLDFRMGKVTGVTTGVLAARHQRVVIADDDIRYDEAGLQRVAAMLDAADLVRPQNHFDPLPWHARLDTARTLLNRVLTGDREFPVGDFPGTLAIRRSVFLATGGYDGDAMFENLELMRTVYASGGRIATPLDLYVRRIPPTNAHFRSQRVRQAFDDFAVPRRMAFFLALPPLVAVAAFRRWWRALFAGAAGIATVAEAGRRRAGGRSRFPASASVLAPLWALERGLSAWLAVQRRLQLGGVRYAGSVVPLAANSVAELRRRHGGLDLSAATLGPEPDHLVGPVAERVDPGAPAAADRHGAPA